MAKKKRAWDNSNALYRYLHGRKSTKKARGASMARRTRHSRSRSGFGGGKLMNGLWRPQGMLGQAISGLGAGYASTLIPVEIPYKTTIAAFLVGGIPGAAANLLVGNMSGGVSVGSTGIKMW